MNYLINRNINMNSKNKSRQQLPLQGDPFIKNHINTNHIGTTKNMLHDLNHVNNNNLQTDKHVEQQIEALEVLNSYIEDLLKKSRHKSWRESLRLTILSFKRRMKRKIYIFLFLRKASISDYQIDNR